MTILLTGSTGGIGSAIRTMLAGHEVIEPKHELPFAIPQQQFDWLIFAHGILSESEPQKTFQVNVISCILFLRRFLTTLKRGGGVIFISSTAGIKGNSKFPIYAASKAAINSLTKSMALAHTEQAFYALCPGPTNTRMWRDLKLDGTAQEPEVVARVVQRIMQGEFVSGDIITVRNGEVTL